MNLMMLLEMASSTFGERVAVQNGGATLTYEELFRAATGVANQIKDGNVEHLSLLDVSSLAVPVALFGSACAGVPFVPLNYRLTGDELDALLGRIEPAHLVTDPERAEKLEGRDKLSVTTASAFLDGAKEAGASGASDWPMDADEIAILLFTSGTTGAPKAAVLRHKHLTSYILGSVEFGGADEDQATLVSVPPYHIAGMAALLSSVYSGRRIVQLPSFDAGEWLSLARSEHVTHAFVVPTMLSRIIDELGDVSDAELPRLQNLSYGGGKMPISVIERAMKLFPNTNFTNAYGLTETSSTLSLLGPDDHRDAMSSDDAKVRQRLVSVGRPLPTMEVEIRREDGSVADPGERGEITVRGEQVSGEYLGRDSLLDPGGWFATRDGGWIDEEGYLFVEGRIDDVIVRGGENLSPGEIEDTILEFGGVADVAVVGVPSEQWGEAVAAAIVLRDEQKSKDPDSLRGELRDWVKRHLRSSRVPERIEFVDELPYNETGKLLRRTVRADLAASE